jgi:hypothetical protein
MRQPVLPFLAILLMAGPACGALPRTGGASAARTAPSASSEPLAQPVGIPRLMAWDGVSHRILMSYLARSNNPPTMDSNVYAFAERKWTRVSPPQSMPNNSLGLLVYDSDRNREVLAYGSAMVNPSALGTWGWDGKTWTLISSARQLPYLAFPSAAYSPDLHAVVILDPCSSSADKPPGKSLLFDGADWRSISSAHWPECPAQLAYSPQRHAIVALSFANNRTWSFDGRDWSPITPTGIASPARTTGPPMGNQMNILSSSAAFDAKRDTWVLFGGLNGDNNFADTWTGDGSWMRRSSSNSPIGRARAGMVWDPDLDAVVLFGGFVGLNISNPPVLSDTWSWDGSAWHQLAGPVYHGPPASAARTA